MTFLAEGITDKQAADYLMSCAGARHRAKDFPARRYQIGVIWPLGSQSLKLIPVDCGGQFVHLGRHYWKTL